jgi:hypothetical protein
MRAESVVTNSQVVVVDLPAQRDDWLDCFEPEVKPDGPSRPRRPPLHKETPRRPLRVVRGRRQPRGFWQRGPVFGWSVFLSVFTCGIFIGALLAGPVTPSTTPVKGVAAAPRLAPEPSTLAATPPAVVRDEHGTAGSEVDTVAGRARVETVPSQRPRVVVPRLSGTLIVTSTPRGASVYLNNKLAGETPLVMRGLAAGSRAVRVDLDGYARWSRGIQVVADQATTISAHLDRSGSIFASTSLESR